MTSATLPFETALRSDSEIKRYPTFRQLSVEKPDFTVAYVMAALLGCVCGIAIAVYSGSGLNLSTLFNSEISSTGAADVIAPETTVAGKDFPAREPGSQTGKHGIRFIADSCRLQVSGE